MHLNSYFSSFFWFYQFYLQSRSSGGIVTSRAVGISGIERRYAENHRRTHESISMVNFTASFQQYVLFAEFCQCIFFMIKTQIFLR